MPTYSKEIRKTRSQQQKEIKIVQTIAKEKKKHHHI